MATRSVPPQVPAHVPTPAPASWQARARRQLQLATRAWFGATFLGQVLFAAFILLFYYPSTLAGDYAAWNVKPLITGYVAGDTTGNRQFAIHVLAAAIMTIAGLLQMIPQLRQHSPRLHRWSGRIFLCLAFLLAAGGMWLTWIRGSHLTTAGAAAITMDAGLIVGCGIVAWSSAMARDFAAHRRWALRTFIVASGVWFMRVGYIAWGVLTGGVGIAKGMSGPFDLIWAFATHLLPLAVLELFLRAERSTPAAQLAMTGLLWVASVVIVGGSIGAWLLMWWPPIAG